ncbi:MAG: hypothetical protein AB1668_05775 [Nanoarchaeota archaeon]
MTNLETRTVLMFRDGAREWERSYQGLLTLQEGDTINVIRTSENFPISPGDYRIQKGSIPNQMSIALDETKPDNIYRYFVCEKLSK